MSAQLIAVSGLGPKEPAAFVVEADGHRLLLDCGEGPEPDRLPDFEKIGRVDAVILSHSHTDHCGALRLRDRIGSPPVYATAPTLARIKESAGHAILIRGTADVLGITVETGANGHAPGGVWMRLAVGEGLLYMGDYSMESRLFTFDTPPPTPTMIFDGSYGDAEVRQDAERPLIRDLAARSPVLFPVPADGRACDIAIFLQDSGIEIAIDDSVRASAEILCGAARESVRSGMIPALERLLKTARRLDGDSEPRGAMIAHGGSGDTGVAGILIKRWQNAQNPAIVITGHAAVGTTSRRLLDTTRATFQRWNVHSTMSDNLKLIEAVSPKRVIPAFGDTRFYPLWKAKVAPRELVVTTPLSL